MIPYNPITAGACLQANPTIPTHLATWNDSAQTRQTPPQSTHHTTPRSWLAHRHSCANDARTTTTAPHTRPLATPAPAHPAGQRCPPDHYATGGDSNPGMKATLVYPRITLLLQPPFTPAQALSGSTAPPHATPHHQKPACGGSCRQAINTNTGNNGNLTPWLPTPTGHTPVRHTSPSHTAANTSNANRKAPSSRPIHHRLLRLTIQKSTHSKASPEATNGKMA